MKKIKDKSKVPRYMQNLKKNQAPIQSTVNTSQAKIL